MRQPLEDRLTISLPDLKKRGYFEAIRSGRLSWYVGDRVYASVWLAVSISGEVEEDEVKEPRRAGGRLTISYEKGGRLVCQQIELLQRPGNLGGGGGIWYFICPLTGRCCRTLYDGPGGFASRHAEGGLRYRAQLYSRHWRALVGGTADRRQAERVLAAWQWLAKPHSKRSYGGQPTRPMLRFQQLTRNKAG